MFIVWINNEKLDLNETITNSGQFYAVDGLNKISITQSKREQDKTQARKFTQDMVFYGRGFEIIKTELIDPEDGGMRSIPFEIHDDCCTDGKGRNFVLFKGVIRGDGIDWCEGECHVTATASEDEALINCIESTLVYDNTLGFQNKKHPRMSYCLEFDPGILHDIIIISLFSLIPILETMRLLVATFNLIFVIISKVLKFVGVKVPSWMKNGIYDEYSDFVEEVERNFSTCGRRLPSPLVRDYIQNVCDICDGIQFKSTILNNPISEYYNSVWFHPEIREGHLYPPNFMLDNAPILTLDQMLDKLKPVFNAKWVLDENNTLLFERKDEIQQQLGNWIDYSILEEQGKIKSKICYSWNSEDRPAFGEFKYSKDQEDTVGNGALSRYNDIVEWNKPSNPIQGGKKEVTLQFGTPRFRGDGVDRDVLSFWEWLPFVGHYLKKDKHAIIMNNGKSTYPKLLIWDGKDLGNGTVVRRFVSGFPVGKNANFNFPYLFNEHNNIKDTAQPSNTPDAGLYPRFHDIDNPRTANKRGVDFEFELFYDCDILRSYNINKGIVTPKGLGEITDFKLNPLEKTIEVKGRL